MNNRSIFIHHLQKKFPELKSLDLEAMVAENMISDFTIELPSSVLEQIETAITTFQKLRDQKTYQLQLTAELERNKVQDCHHNSVMMSYDFHLTEQNQLKLIEINTNAAFHLLGLEMYQSLGQNQSWTDFDSSAFKEMIEEELERSGVKFDKNLPLQVAITDEKPTEQRLFIEFLAYRELFKSYGWSCDILDANEITAQSPYKFIYNRHTDFYWATPATEGMKQLSYSGKACVSPHPFEYLLLADKERMTQWHAPGFLDHIGLSEAEISTIKAVTPQSLALTRETSENLWTQRKAFFFKPMRAFGSKQSYRGGSISRKAFEDLIDAGTIAQEFCPAPTKNFATPEGTQEFKFDLRCYAYRDQLQSVVARIYQGQVTNLRTPHGGFAPVLFKS